MVVRTSSAQESGPSLAERASRCFWGNFTALADEATMPVIVRGEGSYVFDDAGRRYLDGLSAMFCVNVGHGRRELAEAAAEQAARLGYFHAWGAAHPAAIELAERIAGLASRHLNRVFFTSGGSESVESALKLVRNYHLARGDDRRVKVIARDGAYHGTTLGALSASGIDDLRRDFEPLIAPGGCHVPNTDVYRLPEGADALDAAAAIEERILAEGPETVGSVILEPMQNNGGCLVPPPGYFARVREICDRHGVLLISDEVICAWGRLGTMFGHRRYDYEPDIVTTAKGITSGYVPMGAVIASDRVAEPFVDGGALYAHGFTFGAHPVAAAVALRNIDVLEDERLCEHVAENEPALRATLEGLRDIPIVGDVRGDGFFYSLELVKDKETKATFTPAERDELIKQFLVPRARELGVYMRVDDRGETAAQFAPPLVAGQAELDEFLDVLRQILDEAWDRFVVGAATVA